MELFHLRYFLAVADELNLTRAAARLHLAASPLSRRVRDLERELGAPLFTRSARGMALTAAGRALLPRARDIVARVEALPGALAAADGHPVVVVGDGPGRGRRRSATASWSVCGPRARSWRCGSAPAPLRSWPARSPARAGPGLRPRRRRRPRAERTTGETRPAAVAVGHGRGFDDRTEVALEELADLPYVSIRYDAAPSVYRATGELLARHGVHRRIELDTHNPGDLTHVVASGEAFTLVGLGSGATHKAFVGEPVHVLPVTGGAGAPGHRRGVAHRPAADPGDVVGLLAAAAGTPTGPVA
ncbi:LysR family transcriptional regulator [Pseudonocardia sp. ICBG601]|uniref:LysR family transcriptional regulator n=1 Tax=Pseudonocardia sp. ICBG601 TaxID=2846759 RepID=UPI001CF61675|nr:LysR family transcriptional regulator [Pseudonocardia sp. ICBG601]